MKKVCLAILSIIIMNCNTQEIEKIDKGSADGALSYRMYNPNVINPDKEWSYSPKSTTVIGIPFTPKPVQVTFDGAIYTGTVELCFFYGETLKPILINQKRFHKGWIPIVLDEWEEKGVNYSIEMFGTQLEGEDSQNSVQFVKVTMHNTSGNKITGRFAAAITASGGDRRYHQGKDDHENAQFNFTNNDFLRNGSVLYTSSDSPSHYSSSGNHYVGEFKGSDYSIKKSTPTGISVYNNELNPNEKKSIFFKMPRVPFDKKEAPNFYRKFTDANYELYKSKTIEFWENLITSKSFIKIPEKRVNDSYKAGLVHLILATRSDDGKKRQGSGLPYDDLFFNDFVDMRRVYDLSNLGEFVVINTQWLIDNQNEKGMFLDPILTHGKEIMASHGQALVSLSHHYVMTQDKEYLEWTYPTIKKAVEWMQARHEEIPNGLMPASIPFDAEMIKGHYTSHNLWSLLGLRDAIRVAKISGNSDDAKKWTTFHTSYEKAILKAIDSSAKEDGYIPPGLYDYIKGDKARSGFKAFRIDQDWENMLLVYPTETLLPSDIRVSGTLNRIRSNKYREGIMTYRNGMHLHQYATTNLANQYLSINDQKKALLDLYHILLHNGSTHEGFENMIEPWEDRDSHPSPQPHAWAAAKTSLLIRNCLIREHGGKAGLDENLRDLYLFSVISPEWLKKGETIEIQNMPTEMGNISAQLTATDEGAIINIENKFHRNPNRIAIPIPYYVNLSSVDHNAKFYELKNEIMYFSSEVSEIKIKWDINKKSQKQNVQNILMSYRKEPGTKWEGGNKDEIEKEAVSYMNSGSDLIVTAPGPGFLLLEEKNIPNEQLSFELVKKAFSIEYARRFDEYKASGKKELPFLSPYAPLVSK